jgi:hypothetical protein
VVEPAVVNCTSQTLPVTVVESAGQVAAAPGAAPTAAAAANNAASERALGVLGMRAPGVGEPPDAVIETDREDMP